MIIAYIVEFVVKSEGGIIQFYNKIKQKPKLIRHLFGFIIKIYTDKHNSYLGNGAKISNSVIFPHGFRGIFISSDAVIGENCVIFQQVTIGSNTIQDSKTTGSPIIHDNCYIGAGAKIIGCVEIGRNCRIGANCVVTSNVEDNSVVVLEKPRQIKKSNMNNKYYSKNKNGQLCYFENGKTYISNSIDKNIE